jgi:glucose-6-phosphate isomerase
MSNPLKYDWENMQIAESDVATFQAPTSRFPFESLLTGSVTLIKRYADIIRSDFKNYVIVGIGGSDLGSRAIYESLKARSDNKVNISFLGANLDPLEIDTFFKNIDLSTTVFAIISKSGETVEILSQFLYLRKILKDKFPTDFTKHIIAITNPNQTGTLYQICQSEGIVVIPGPVDIGDRFSVLSIIGLLTAEVMGLDSQKFLEGARSIDQRDALTFASLSYISYKKYNKNISVLMPYSSELRQFAFWFRQLWAESLGKSGLGITPIASIGATDQHSQIQLYNEGPNDKIITFIEVKDFGVNQEITTEGLDEITSIQFLNKKNIQDILHIERASTAKSLTDFGRSHGTIFIERLDEASLGALFYFFQTSVAILGSLLGINPFDQPGVEKGKEYIYKALGK